MPRLTLVLPLENITPSSSPNRFLEFYQGFLLGVDTLKSLGLSFEVQVFSVDQTTASVNRLIESGKLDLADGCLGGATPEQIQLLSNWSRQARKPFFVPFNSRISELENNPFLYQMLTPYEQMYERTVEYLMIRYAGSQFMLLKPSASYAIQPGSFQDILRKHLRLRGITCQEQVIDETCDTLVSRLSDLDENVLIPHQMSLNDASLFVSYLDAAAQAVPDKRITLIGYPEWQAMNQRYQQSLYRMNTFLFSNFYADPQQTSVKQFQRSFYLTFGQHLMNTLPKYGMLGYDAAIYFIPRLIQPDAGRNLSVRIEPLQTACSFEAVSTTGGQRNQLFYLIHYLPEGRLEVKTLQ
jgi:hypothetical protein